MADALKRNAHPPFHLTLSRPLTNHELAAVPGVHGVSSSTIAGGGLDLDMEPGDLIDNPERPGILVRQVQQAGERRRTLTSALVGEMAEAAKEANRYIACK